MQTDSGMDLLLQVATLAGRDTDMKLRWDWQSEGLKALANYLLLYGIESAMHSAHN